MNTRLFWRAAAVQGALVGAVFVLLLLALSSDFFEDNGVWVGPLVWIACAFVSARILDLPLSFALFCALAGAIAGTLVGLVFTHGVGMVAGVLVFAASASGYERPGGEAAAP